jgi:hypothetical protein
LVPAEEAPLGGGGAEDKLQRGVFEGQLHEVHPIGLRRICRWLVILYLKGRYCAT